MRIATWNLQSDKPLSEKRLDLFRQAMVEVGADVWVITESWTDFCPLSGYRLVSQSSQAVDLGSTRRWVAIWSRLDAEPLDLEGQPERMAGGRIRNSGGRATVVVGTVLPWPFDPQWPSSTGFRAALDIQSAEWMRISKLEDGDFFVAGDLNQSLPNQRYYGSKQNEIALYDVFESLNLLCLTLGNDSSTGAPRIDHILADRKCTRSSDSPDVGTWAIPCINEKQITDHSGAFVDVDIRS